MHNFFKVNNGNQNLLFFGILFVGVVEVLLVAVWVFMALSMQGKNKKAETEVSHTTTLTPTISQFPSQEVGTSPFCVGTHLDQYGDSLQKLNRELDLLKELGSGWTRFDFEVQRFVNEDGNTDFSYFDPILRGLEERGIRLIAILPQWGETGDDYKDLIETPERYGMYAGMLAKYLKETNVEFVIEVGNEPNDPGFWPDRDPEEYTEYLKSAYDEIKKIDENIKVLTGGIVMYKPDNPENGEFNSIDWLNGMYESGVKSADSIHAGNQKLHFDLFAVHIYSGKDEPERQYDEIKKLVEIINRNGNDIKIAITEIGWSTGTDDSNENVSEEMQAQSIKNFYTRLYADPILSSVVELGCYYTLVDPDEGPELENNWGLLDENLRPKPGFGAFKDIVKTTLIE